MLQNLFGVYNRSCVCEWCDQRSNMISEERKYFWKQVQRELCRFCGLHTNSRHYSHNGRNLYNMKSYVWPLGEEMFAFKIGLNPLKSFQVEIILEREEDPSECVNLDSRTVNELFSIIRKLYQLNACHPVFDTANGPNTGCVHINVYNHGLYTLSIQNQSMALNDKNLLTLIDLQPWIMEILQIYEFERIQAELSLFRLLEVFSKKKYSPRSSELIELITAPCSYVPVGFIIEIGTQHYNLFNRLLEIYRETLAMFKNAHFQGPEECESSTL